MGVQHTARKLIETWKFRNVRDGEVPCRTDDVVEHLGPHLVFVQILDRDAKFACYRVVFDETDRRAEIYVLAHIALLDAALDVIVQHGARRVRRNRTAEMLFEGIIGKFQTFLRPIRPKKPIHAAVDRLAIFVEARSPGVIPEAAPLRLLLEANEFWNISALAARRFERAQSREATGSGAEDRDTLGH